MTQARIRWTTTAITAALLALGSTNAVGQNLPTGHVPVPASGGQETLAIVVLETIDGGGYTYARFEMEGEEAWAAGPQTTLEVGDTVLVTDPMPMENFTSGSLNRTFDVLYFVGGFVGQAAGADGSGSIPTDGPMGEAREVLHSAGYTYIRVETEDEAIWIAGPTTQVEESQIVSWRGAMQMGAFTSRTLNRSFDEIVFVQQIIVVR